MVTGDALFAQRNLSAQIGAAGGADRWTVQANQPALLDEIRWLFTPLQPGERSGDWDWRTARTLTSGHGRVEERTLVASTALARSSDGPGWAQVCQRTVRRTDKRRGQTTESVRYGVTSLSAAAAGPAVLGLGRGHWGIEGGLQQRRGVTLGEAGSQVRDGHAPQVLACLNNVVIGLMSLQGGRNLAEVRRDFD